MLITYLNYCCLYQKVIGLIRYNTVPDGYGNLLCITVYQHTLYWKVVESNRKYRYNKLWINELMDYREWYDTVFSDLL